MSKKIRPRPATVRPAPEYQLKPGTYTVGPDVDLETDDVRDSQGARINQEYVERIVEHVQAATRDVGRPSLSDDGGQSPIIVFRVSPTLHTAAADRAEQEGTSVSKLVRRALEAYLRAS